MSAQEAYDLGSKIQEARRSTGQELCSIAGEICVSKSYLTAIEDGRFDALPAFPFAMGFVRSFAHQVGLDANEIAMEFKAIVKPVIVEDADAELVSDPVIELKKSVKRGPLYGGLAVVLSAMSAVWMIFLGGGQQAAYVKTTPPADVVQFAEAKVEGRLAGQDIKLDSVIPAKQETNEVVVDAVADEDFFAPANNQVLGVANAGDEGAKDLNLQDTEVMFEARQDAWVRISSGDSILFEGVLRSGDHYVPPMGPQLSLTTSNAGGLALRIGEHDLGVLGVKGGIIENVKIDPDSLILRLVETL